MSVVNQMLKDLARRSKPSSNPELILIGLTTPRSPKKKNKFFYWLCGIGLFFLLITVVLILQKTIFYNDSAKKPSMTMTLKIPMDHLSKPSSQRSTIELPIKQTGLTDIALQVKEDESRLRLLLTQKAFYRITGHVNNQIVLVLENARIISDFPQIDTMNSAINNIHMFGEPDGNLKIILKLNPGAELKSLSLYEGTQSPELNIDFAYNAIAAKKEKEESLRFLARPQNYPIKKSSYDTTIDDEYQRAIQPIESGQIQDAEIRLTKFLAKYPKFVAARKSYATLLMQQDKFEEAQQIIDVGLQQMPFYPPYIQLKAQMLVDKEKIKEALNLLLKVPPAIEDNPDYHALIAALYQRQNQSKLAEKLYEQLVSMQPTNSIWWMGLGLSRETLNKTGSALEAYTKAISAEDLSPELKVYVENRIQALS